MLNLLVEFPDLGILRGEPILKGSDVTGRDMIGAVIDALDFAPLHFKFAAAMSESRKSLGTQGGDLQHEALILRINWGDE